MALPATEFLRRFLLHVVPSGVHAHSSLRAARQLQPRCQTGSLSQLACADPRGRGQSVRQRRTLRRGERFGCRRAKTLPDMRCWTGTHHRVPCTAARRSPMTPALVTSISAGTAHLFARALARRRTRARSTPQSPADLPLEPPNHQRRSPPPAPTAACPRVRLASPSPASAAQNTGPQFNPHRTRRSGYAA